ncbi:MAG TPA: hypothetical protein PKY59_14580 [Pyrinomonadaceae bacterium]|nr:hypothetical protein [Pyrinomonadaceae bacterium]
MYFYIDKKYPQFIDIPDYGFVDNNGFGRSMKVVLGPAAGLYYAGKPTSADHSIPHIMKALKKRDGGKVWVAAHLLNGELGGDGHDSENLAPLTQTANKQHSGLELGVKTLCNLIRQWHNLYDDSFYFGVKYSVNTIGYFGTFDPYNKVPSHFNCSCSVGKYTLKGVETAITSQEKSLFSAYTFSNVQIHNRDSHILGI